MDIRILRYFLAVAREESISGAAEYLHLSLPTLSRQLMELEEDLGKTLFIRGSRRITLTEHGTLLRKRADEILNLMEKTTSELPASDESVAGNIYIGGGESNAMRLIASTAQQFRSVNPRVQFHMFSGNAVDVGERLDKGLLDFGVMMGHGNFKKYDGIVITILRPFFPYPMAFPVGSMYNIFIIGYSWQFDHITKQRRRSLF